MRQSLLENARVRMQLELVVGRMEERKKLAADQRSDLIGGIS